MFNQRDLIYIKKILLQSYWNFAISYLYQFLRNIIEIGKITMLLQCYNITERFYEIILHAYILYLRIYIIYIYIILYQIHFCVTRLYHCNRKNP